jgi:glucose-1-phosphate adenylyltransferase
VALASMGIYVFKTRLLERVLEEDAFNADSSHDFGRNIIPAAIHKRSVYAYRFEDVKTRAQSYWRDVGNVDAFYEANMELVYVAPELNLYDAQWPIWTYQVQQPPAKFVLDEEGRRGFAVNSMVAGGCIISGAAVHESLLFSNVRVEEGSHVEKAVVLPGVRIGPGCRIRHAVIDEDTEIPAGTVIGYDREADARRFFITKNGVVLATADMFRDAS